jgi:hypothetical protein
MQQFQHRPSPTRAQFTETTGPIAAGGSGGLSQQASQYANVARHARDECHKGQQAEKELQRRRNKSGQ